MQVNHASGCIEEKNGNKYLLFDYCVNENKELLKRYADVWDGIKNKISDTKENDYEKDYMKIKFNSDDDLLLNKPLKFHAMIIIIRSVFLKKMVDVILNTRFCFIIRVTIRFFFSKSSSVKFSIFMHSSKSV